jgi:hypothetical protein
LATAPEAYAEGQTLYLDLTFFAQASLAFLVLALGMVTYPLASLLSSFYRRMRCFRIP